VAGSGEHLSNYEAVQSHLLKPQSYLYWAKWMSKTAARQTCWLILPLCLKLNDEIKTMWATLGIYFLKKKKKKI
jgi:hypothetical protein